MPNQNFGRKKIWRSNFIQELAYIIFGLVCRRQSCHMMVEIEEEGKKKGILLF